jgi:hypothetical protein
MWARVAEVLLACWLGLSPWIFRYPADDRFLWVTSFASAVCILFFSLLSYSPQRENAHLLNLVVAAGLIGTGFLGYRSPPPPAVQNFVTVGLLLLMFAIVPSRASQPPRSWQEFHARGE